MLLVMVGLLTLATGGSIWYIYNTRQENRDLKAKIASVEEKISASVEQRLVSHTKYCEQVDALVKERLAEEEAKWRELIEAATCRVSEAVDEHRRATVSKVAGCKKEAAEKLAEDMEEIKATLEKQKMNFKSLLDQAYLEEYEKNVREFSNPEKPLAFKNLRVIAMVQDDSSKEILQAVQLEVPENK